MGAWSSAGPAAGGGAWAWEGPFHALDTPRDSAGVAINIPNVAVGPVPAGTVVPGVGAIQAFMAIEGNTPGSDGNFLAVNVGSDGDLGANWVNLNYSTHSLGPYQDVCQAGGCPSARYANGWFYVMGGGVDLARSRNLSHGSWERPPLDPVVWGCTDGWEDCSPGSDVARIADGYFTEYWAQGGDRGMREYLKNITEWNWSSSDVDFCEHQGVTYFICAWRVERGRARAWLRGALSLPRPPFQELACNSCVTAPPPHSPITPSPRPNAGPRRLDEWPGGASQLDGQGRQFLRAGHVQRQRRRVAGELFQQARHAPALLQGRSAAAAGGAVGIERQNYCTREQCGAGSKRAVPHILFNAPPARLALPPPP